MIIRQNETQVHKVKNETLNGLNVMAYLTSSVLNTPIPDTDYGTGVAFDPSMINIQVDLIRDGRVPYNIIGSNLGIVAGYNTILKNGSLWRKGITLVEPAVGAYHSCCRNVFIYFGGHIQVSGNDELRITVTLTRGTFNTGVNATNSSLQVETNQSIGVEHWIPQFRSYAIQEGKTEDTVQLGDNIMRLALMSFEKDWKKPIFNSCTLSSDRLDWNANEQELILRHWDNFPYNSADLVNNDYAVNQHPLYYPNTFVIHDMDEIDKAKVKFTMVASNVEPSRNFVAYTSYETNRTILEKAAMTKRKHAAKDLEKVQDKL